MTFSWVAVEVTTTQLTRPAVLGASIEDLEQGIERLVEKASQLHATIGELITDESRLTGGLPRPRRRLAAVLVVTEGFPVNAMTMRTIRERLRDADLLQDPRIGPLHILDQEELEMVEALVEDGAYTFLQLLEDHEAAAFRDMPFKDWVMMEKRLTVPRPARAEAAFEGVWEPALAALAQAAHPAPEA